jgi:hypothetical protein
VTRDDAESVRFWAGGPAEHLRALAERERAEVSALEARILACDDESRREALAREIEETRTRFAEERRRLGKLASEALY